VEDTDYNTAGRVAGRAVDTVGWDFDCFADTADFAPGRSADSCFDCPLYISYLKFTKTNKFRTKRKELLFISFLGKFAVSF